MKRFFVSLSGKRWQVRAQSAGNGLMQLHCSDGEAAQHATATLRQASNGDWLVDIGGITRCVQISRDGDKVWLSDRNSADYSSNTVLLQRGDEKRQTTHSAESVVRSPMTGRVVTVTAQIGETVAKGQALLIVEAMKMEHTLRAPRAGVISKIACVAGQLVEGGAELIELEPAK